MLNTKWKKKNKDEKPQARHRGTRWTILQGLEILGPKEVWKQALVILSLEIP